MDNLTTCPNSLFLLSIEIHTPTANKLRASQGFVHFCVYKTCTVNIARSGPGFPKQFCFRFGFRLWHCWWGMKIEMVKSRKRQCKEELLDTLIYIACLLHCQTVNWGLSWYLSQPSYHRYIIEYREVLNALILEFAENKWKVGPSRTLKFYKVSLNSGTPLNSHGNYLHEGFFIQYSF